MARAEKTNNKRHLSTRVAGRNLPRGDLKGGNIWQRPRLQFQALYMLIGTFDNTKKLSEELVLWPLDEDGNKRFVGHMRMVEWCENVDDGKEIPDEKIQQMMKRRFEAQTDAKLRLQVNANADAARILAMKIVNGEALTNDQRQQLIATNNGAGFVQGQAFNKRMPTEEKVKKIGRTKIIAAKKREPTSANVTQFPERTGT